MAGKEVEMGAVVPSKDDIQTQLQEQYLKSLEGLEEGDLVDGHGNPGDERFHFCRRRL